jgi:hypothetical protein
VAGDGARLAGLILLVPLFLPTHVATWVLGMWEARRIRRRGEELVASGADSGRGRADALTLGLIAVCSLLIGVNTVLGVIAVVIHLGAPDPSSTVGWPAATIKRITLWAFEVLPFIVITYFAAAESAVRRLGCRDWMVTWVAYAPLTTSLIWGVVTLGVASGTFSGSSSGW